MHRGGAKILWLAVLLALLAVVGVKLFSGDVLLYLAPRMVPMVWFGFIVLAVLLIYQGFEFIRSLLRRETAAKPRAGMVLFLVPVVLMLTVMPDASTPGSLPNQNVQMISLTDESGAAAQQTDAPQDDTASAEETDGGYDLQPCVLEDEQTFFDSSADLFSDYLHETVEDMVGRTVTVYGFVYFDDTFPERTVLVSRLLLTCCAADASIVGFHVQVEAENDLQENEWIRVTGTIRKIALLYYGNYYDVPILTDGLIVRCDAPEVEDAYIYP